jgi:hypothetical protein
LNKTKSRIGYVKGQINSLNRQIKGLEAIGDKTKQQEERLEKLKRKLSEVYSKYLTVKSR